MSQIKSGPPARYQEQDFEAIEAAVMETSRGRWFLTEFARRNRNSDTETVLKAIRKLHGVVSDRREPGADLREIQQSIMDMATEIARTRRELADLRADNEQEGGIPSATDELDAVVAGTEKATSNILQAAEHIQELAWTMREEGGSEQICDALDAYATEIYTHCSFQDLTGQRIRRVTSVLRDIESRLDTLVNGWSLHDIELRAPDEDKPGSSEQACDVAAAMPVNTQEDIDLLLIDRKAAEEIVFEERPPEREQPGRLAAEDEPRDAPADAIVQADAESDVAFVATDAGDEVAYSPEAHPENRAAVTGEPKADRVLPAPPPADGERGRFTDSDNDIFAQIAAELERVTAEAVRAQVAAELDRAAASAEMADTAAPETAAADAAMPVATSESMEELAPAPVEFANEDPAPQTGDAPPADMPERARALESDLDSLSRAHRMALFS